MIVRSRILLAIEFVAFFIALPIVLYIRPRGIPIVPFLWGCTAYCLVTLLFDKTFRRAELWRPWRLRNHRTEILTLFITGAILIAGLVWRFEPQRLFGLVKTNPMLWALVMAFYPVFSVYPQGIIYRSFVMHRYRPLLRTRRGTQRWMLIAVSALSFSFMHIIFHNWIAVTLTLIGGVLFARTHLKTRSLFVSSFEHALYGCFLFTIGLGSYFYAQVI